MRQRIKDFIITIGRLFYKSQKRKPKTTIDYLKKSALKNSVKTFYKHMINATIIEDKEKFRIWCLNYSLNNPITGPKIFAEFGVFKGSSINNFAKVLDDQIIYGFDSFRGLEEDWGLNNLKGKMDLEGSLPKVEKNVRIIVGKIQDTLNKFLNETKGNFQFIHLDMDTYIPTNFILSNIRRRLKKNTIILFDELHGYTAWETHEYKALLENLNEDEYKYIGFSKNQAAIIIMKNLS
tara:strand:- start:193 stop:900 length:708 start_codon:yes stop_codon:yes gene_type:complete